MQRYELRLEKAKPILAEIEIWLDKSLETAVQNPKGHALIYSSSDGRYYVFIYSITPWRLRILARKSIRSFDLRRKKWLFSEKFRSCRAPDN